jgi:hypothetical protein
MFVFALITAELFLLYVAFWYLYLREPGTSGRIKGSLWGTYDESVDAYGDNSVSAMHQCHCGPNQHSHSAPAYAQEFVLDALTNRYVPVRDSGSMLVQLADSIDKTFGQLNVRP